MGSTLKAILLVIVGLVVLLYVIGLVVPDDRPSSGGRYRSLSDCLSKTETPAMVSGEESNAPAVARCRNWRDYR
ncbi:MAG: hypothetical protein F4Y95_07345 [Chloroflexi bacterium]|nr:hypothetical protein [Chloroflexota bacterium]